MIGALCCYLWLLVARGQTLAENKDLTNYFPYYEPQIESVRIKEGASLALKCARKGLWEYKPCSVTYTGVSCDTKDVARREEGRSVWKRIRTRDRLKLGNAKLSRSGVYRCVEKGVVRRAILVEVVAPDNYNGPPPSVASLKATNSTGQFNLEYTIRCNVTSVVPPTIIWFKRCSGHKCGIQYDSICYCHLNESSPILHLGSTHIGKFIIFNAQSADSGLYACLAVTEFGKDYRNITIDVPAREGTTRHRDFSISLIFLIPLNIVFVPVIIWLCYMRRQRRASTTEQQKKLLRLNVVAQTL